MTSKQIFWIFAWLLLGLYSAICTIGMTGGSYIGVATLICGFYIGFNFRDEK